MIEPAPDCRRRLACGILLAAFALATPAASQEPFRVTLVLRVVDDSTHAGIPDAIFRVDSAQVLASMDSTHRYTLSLALPAGSHRLDILRVGYVMHRREVVVAQEGVIVLGTIALRAAVISLSEDLFPLCVRVHERPRTLVPLTWIQPAPDSAGRKTWYFCDARGPKRD